MVALHVNRWKAEKILQLFQDIQEYSQVGFTQCELIQLYISGIAKDRISDIACNYIKSFLIDYTIERCESLGIPIESVNLDSIYNNRYE